MNVDEFQAEFNVSRETMAKLLAYEALLRKWQLKINLIGPATLGQLWHRHFADSFQLLPLAPVRARRWVDLGSGAGFPGLVVAMAGCVEETILIESDKRKAAFLQAVIRETGAAARVAAGRIEDHVGDLSLVSDIVSARALAPLPKLLEFAAPFLHDESVVLLPKGREWAKEIEMAQKTWRFQHELIASRTDDDARIIKLTHIMQRA